MSTIRFPKTDLFTAQPVEVPDLPRENPRPQKRRTQHRLTLAGEKTRCCPFLTGRKQGVDHVDYPSLSNVCTAQQTQKKTLLRVTVYPFSSVTPKQQSKTCLWSYKQCPYYHLETAKQAQTLN